MIINLPVRLFKSGEEHYPIKFYFENGVEYEMAIFNVALIDRPKGIASITTNILEYSVLNPEQVIGYLGHVNYSRISAPVYYKIDVGSLENLRIKIAGIANQSVAISLDIRKVNGP